jgi:hypothetical protein
MFCCVKSFSDIFVLFVKLVCDGLAGMEFITKSIVTLSIDKRDQLVHALPVIDVFGELRDQPAFLAA